MKPFPVLSWVGGRNLLCFMHKLIMIIYFSMLSISSDHVYNFKIYQKMPTPYIGLHRYKSSEYIYNLDFYLLIHPSLWFSWPVGFRTILLIITG